MLSDLSTLLRKSDIASNAVSFKMRVAETNLLCIQFPFSHPTLRLGLHLDNCINFQTKTYVMGTHAYSQPRYHAIR